MRIRGGSRKPITAASFSPPSPSSSSYSSSITASHYSLSSSQDSSSNSSCPPLSSHRCRGLDLLVKAIHQVTHGSAVAVPYIQRRVLIRRSRRSRGFGFEAFMFDQLSHRNRAIDNSKKKKKNREKGLMGLRPGVDGSLLRPWGRRSGLAGDMGL